MVQSNTTKDLPDTHRRSTAETAMNPIGQTFPVIHIHLVGNFEQGSMEDLSGKDRYSFGEKVGISGATHQNYLYPRQILDVLPPNKRHTTTVPEPHLF